MFGGYDLRSEKPSFRNIIINLSPQGWWYEERLAAVEGGPKPRIASSPVTINNHIFIFGGYRSYAQIVYMLL